MPTQEWVSSTVTLVEKGWTELHSATEVSDVGVMRLPFPPSSVTLDLCVPDAQNLLMTTHINSSVGNVN